MKKLLLLHLTCTLLILTGCAKQADKTMDRSDFVMVTDIIPDAILEIRYYSTYNFVGERIDGYEAPVAWMTRQAADSLKMVNDELKAKGYRLKIWDTYRPQRAVNHFIRWAKNIQDTAMKAVFYPMVDKSLLFEQGYIWARSSHSRGSTVDLTLVDAATGKELDMGSPFDWFGEESHPDYEGTSSEVLTNRHILWDAMLAHGFTMIDSEWWHFTLANEPYPDTYFDFPVTCSSSTVATENCTMWYIRTQETATTDIFYVCSTETSDWVNAAGETMHFASMANPWQRAALHSEIHGVDSLCCPENCNFYAPYYNQATIEGLLRDTSLFVTRCAEATKEVIAAFDYYMQHFNDGRRFVLMGYSQGGYAVVELLKHLTEEQAKRMVAAYVIGYQVTESDARYPFIRAAESADDTGVTICYNSVASTESEIAILSGQTAMGINPVNWRTDATPAQYVFDFGGAKDTLTATLDPATHLTIIKGYRTDCRVVPFVGKKGNYHCFEIPLYYRSLKENISLRCQKK